MRKQQTLFVSRWIVEWNASPLLGLSCLNQDKKEGLHEEVEGLRGEEGWEG